MNIEDIVNQILNSYKEEDKRPSGKGMSNWVFRYILQFKGTWPIEEELRYYKEFKNTRAQKEDFEKIFNIKVLDYISPIGYDYTLSNEAISRISNELEFHIEYTSEELQVSLTKMFQVTNPEKWNFDILLAYLPKTHDRRNKLFAQSITNKKPLAS